MSATVTSIPKTAVPFTFPDELEMASIVVTFRPPSAATRVTDAWAGFAVKMHGACAALCDAAAELGFRQFDDISQDPKQRYILGYIDIAIDTVDVYAHHNPSTHTSDPRLRNSNRKPSNQMSCSWMTPQREPR
jgi:hypothetical protein